MNTNVMELNVNEMAMVNGAGWGSFWDGLACGLMPGAGTGAIIGGPVGALVGGGIGAIAGGAVGGAIGYFCGDD